MEALGYGAASAVALAADMGVLTLLVNLLGWPSLAAASVSFLVGATVAYALSVRIAFKQHRLRDRRAEFAGFVAIGGVGLGINVLVISLAMSRFGLHYLLAKCVAVVFTFTWNFAARRQMLFVRGTPA